MMIHERGLEARYFRWLCDFVGVYTDENLLKQLHSTPFVWVVSNDVNRAEDGRELRDSILVDHNVGMTMRDRMSAGAPSVLEVLAALAERASHQTETPLESWFDTYLENLGLKNLMCDADAHLVDDILHDWMTRNIQPNGVGGLFPLRYPPEDQRETEIWYQMSAYLQEDMEADGFFDAP